MSGDADEQAMLAALGFSSFGGAQRSHKRARHSPPSSAPLAQLSPGTELVRALPSDFPSSRVISGSHGVLYLVKEPSRDAETLVRALSRRSEGDDKVAERLDAQKKSETRTAELLERLQRAKKRFDALDSEQFRAARSASNAFERIGRHRFVNRSAMKLATLDHVFGWTQTAAGAGAEDRAFAFADICGGPGGFSEFLLWRSQRLNGQRVDGFGITLRDAANRCDWRLPSGVARVMTCQESGECVATAEKSETDSAATFTICYGADGTGDVYSPANVERFRDVVRERHASGVALVVADGGFLDARDRDNQEAMMTRLVTAEALAMFLVLRPGGDFVCKTFELATTAMRQLVWLLHQCFAEITIVKPVTSRPASSERYIVARSLHAGLPMPDIVKCLVTCVEDAEAPTACDLLPNRVDYDADDPFHQFMAAANDRFATAQIAACEHIMEYAEATPKRQAAMRDEQWRRVRPAAYYACWQLGDTGKAQWLDAVE